MGQTMADNVDLFPPESPQRVYRVGLAGLLACVASLLLSLAGEMNTIRLVLVAAGCLAAGSAVSLRPGLALGWLILSGTFLAARFGLPAHWDSARIVASVGAGVSAGAALLVLMPLTWRQSVISALAVWHFGGIFCATTWPDPTPWTTQQIGTRMYLPYLMFMYLRNAYHFYSPEPGPASLIAALVIFDKPGVDGKPEAQWYTLPLREEHMKDPLGLTYFRRLSITEQAAQSIPATQTTFELNAVQQRRLKAAGQILGGMPNYPQIPLAPDVFEPQAYQYRQPRPDISRYLLPSYANHIMKRESTPERKAVAVKLYRLEHRVTPAYQLGVLKQSPYKPITYRPYYLGEFAVNPETGRVELVDPQDPLLYWLVPILPKTVTPGDPEKIDYLDYLSTHAGYKFDWSQLQP